MKLQIKDYNRFHELFGNLDEYIHMIERAFGVRISCKEESIHIVSDANHSQKSQNVSASEKSGESEKLAGEAVRHLLEGNLTIDRQSVAYVIEEVRSGASDLATFSGTAQAVMITAAGRVIKPKTAMQARYLEALQKYDVTFGVGPAGTGKTFLAVATAIKYLKTGRVSRIIITRPAVEAGENLGFLPGDLQDKVDPYLRPIYDAMFDILGAETFQALREKGIIEIAPLAYMRGRTLDGCFVILDEAQNTTPEQMKMFLTRFGEHSKVAVNGDITQIDLPRGKKSGLKHALAALSEIDEIAFVTFSDRDVVRHNLVRKIIRSYQQYESRLQEKTADEQ